MPVRIDSSSFPTANGRLALVRRNSKNFAIICRISILHASRSAHICLVTAFRLVLLRFYFLLRRSQFHCIASLYATITLTYIIGSKILSQEIFISLKIFHLYEYLTCVFLRIKKLSKLNICYIHGIPIFLWSFHVFTHSIIGLL